MLAFEYIDVLLSVRLSRLVPDDPLLSSQLQLSGQFPFSRRGWPLNSGWTVCYFQRGLREMLNKEATKTRRCITYELAKSSVKLCLNTETAQQLTDM